MGKDLKGKELGVGITQQKDGLYRVGFIDKHGKRQIKRSKKLQELRQWMADEGYRTTTIYQTRIALYNMLEFAKENDVIRNNPCKKSVKSDIGKPFKKRKH